MEIPDITPEQAIQMTEDPAFGPAMMVVTAAMIESMKPSFTAMALIMQDILRSDCTCDSCVRIRETGTSLLSGLDAHFGV